MEKMGVYRPHMLCIRISEDEYAKLMEQVSGSENRLTKSEWIRQRMFAGDRIEILKEIAGEVKKLRIETYYLQQRLADRPAERSEVVDLTERFAGVFLKMEEYMETEDGSDCA